MKVDLTMFDQEESDQSLERLCDLLERYRTWTQILQPQVPFFPPLSYSFPYYPLDVFFFLDKISKFSLARISMKYNSNLCNPFEET